jgi:hypothetical protein
VSQLAVLFNGIEISISGLALGLSMTSNVLLLVVFIVSLIAIGLLSADRLFRISAGARVESVTTIQNENIILRGVRRISRGSFGVLFISGLKDFGRKAQNLSRLALLLILALVVPVFIYIRAGEFELTSVIVMTSLMLGFLGVQVFGGTGFLESKDQLWTIQAAPHGVARYVKAKAVQSIALIIPIVLLPAILYSVILSLDLSQTLYLLATSFLSCVGGALVGIGISANNPTYDDTKSGAYRTNNVRGMMLVVVSFMWYLVADMVLSMLGFGALMNSLWESQLLLVWAQVIPLPIIGLVTISLGSINLSNRE